MQTAVSPTRRPPWRPTITCSSNCLPQDGQRPMIELDSVLLEDHQEMACPTTWEYRKSAFSSSEDEIIRFAQSLRGPAPGTCGGFCRDSLNGPTSYEEPVLKKGISD